MTLARILLALQQPETWYAIATGAGAFGLPAAWLFACIRAGTAHRHYIRGWTDGFEAALERRIRESTEPDRSPR